MVLDVGIQDCYTFEVGMGLNVEEEVLNVVKVAEVPDIDQVLRRDPTAVEVVHHFDHERGLLVAEVHRCLMTA